MIHDEEFDLTWADPPPTWIENAGPLLEFWGNPIFQRRYVLWRMEPSMGIRIAFFVGLGLSLSLNLLFRFLAPEDEYLWLGFLTTIILPGLIVFTLTGLRLFVTSLVGTPLELRRELYSGALGAILSTPLTDSKIFTAECISGLLRGLGAMEEVLSMLAGLVIPFVLVMFPEVWEYVAEAGVETIYWILLFIMLVTILVQLNVLITFAAGLYSIKLPVAATVPATLIHVVGFVFSNLFINGWVLMYLLQHQFIRDLNPLVIYLILCLVWIAALAVVIALTARAGVVAFAKARRPGYYEPDGLNAAGLMSQDPSSVVRFGQSI